MRRVVIAVMVAALMLTLLTDAAVGVTTASAQATTGVAVRLHRAIKRLPVRAHSHVSSYDRSRDFGDWITQYGECDTRAVVLKDESLRPTTQNKYCTVERGRWYSFYNAKYYNGCLRGSGPDRPRRAS
ncbi:MAG: hypothetical protein ACRDPG_13435 [Nocardioidaceae bacterium]